MNGAQALLTTLVEGGVEVCFTNPGTSEMHAVAALDAVPRMQAHLALFEGVATGAADGYARMARRPAAVLLHLGPGLGNGLANLHNARKAASPVVAVVGEHATTHLGRGAPLESDIATIARGVSSWITTPTDPSQVGSAASRAVAAALGPPGQVATIILPGDVSWGDVPPTDDERGDGDGDGDDASGGDGGGGRAGPAATAAPGAGPSGASGDEVDRAAAALRTSAPTVLVLGGPACADEQALRAAVRIGAATGARLATEVFPARLLRGLGVPRVDRLPYFAERAVARLSGAQHVVLAGARAPVAFFALPGGPSSLTPSAATTHVLADPGHDATAALVALADALGAPAVRPPAPSAAERPTGPLDPHAIAQAVAATMPEGTIVSDEAISSGAAAVAATASAPRHDWLTVTGGAIGQGLPVATGAAVACPDRPVLALQADGSAMYTVQALWTQARAGLDVTTVVYDNGAYEILSMELERAGITDEALRARDLFDLTRPRLDFVAIAEGLGVPAVRVDRAEDLTRHLEIGLSTPGPRLISARMVPRSSGPTR